MNEEEFLDAYHGGQPYSYGSQRGVKDFVNITDEGLKTILQKVIYIQDTQSLKNQNLHPLSEHMATTIYGKLI